MISYLITACNEYEELKTLLSHLKDNIRDEDEIVLLLDDEKVTSQVADLAWNLDEKGYVSNVIQFPLQKDFATFKNIGNAHCAHEWIFQIDADEIPSAILLEMLPDILEQNENVDLIYVPRINVVEGITEEHINQWGWRISKNELVRNFDKFKPDSEELRYLRQLDFVISEADSYGGEIGVVFYSPIINFPDFQSRLYRNKTHIKWEGRVHEVITGMKSYAAFPLEFPYCLMHKKTIDRQEKQNQLYSQINR